VLGGAAVHEFDSPERCAAFVATRGALEAVVRAADVWPDALAILAREAARQAATITAESLGHEPASAARRRCLRSALVATVGLTAACEAARASIRGGGEALDEAERAATRAISLLAMFLHANTQTWPDD